VAAGPSPGWYDDPLAPGSIRWWDGERWSEHSQVKPEPELGPEATAAGEAEPAAGPAAERSGPTDAEIAAMLQRPPEPENPALQRAMPIVLAGVAIVLALFLTAIYLSSRTEEDPGAASVPTVATPDEVNADTEAERLAKTAQTAIEAYAADHNGSYENADANELVRIEPSLSGAQLSVDPAADSYTVAVTAPATGNTFTITRDSAGTVSLTCGEPDTGACPAGGLWG
jgi:hypothetical protein